MTDALNALSKPENTLDLMPIKASAEFDTAFWQDSYHYQGGKGPNGETSAYSVDAGAQLLRLSTKAEADLNSPVSTYQNLIKSAEILVVLVQYLLSSRLCKACLALHFGSRLSLKIKR